MARDMRIALIWKDLIGQDQAKAVHRIEQSLAMALDIGPLSVMGTAPLRTWNLDSTSPSQPSMTN